MEAHAAGSPVLVSRTNPMSYFVEASGCGKVIENLCVDDLTEVIGEITEDYPPSKELQYYRT